MRCGASLKHSSRCVHSGLFLSLHDRNVNSGAAAAWLDTVKAPEKQLVLFEHSGHIPMAEEPGKLLFSLVR